MCVQGYPAWICIYIQREGAGRKRGKEKKGERKILVHHIKNQSSINKNFIFWGCYSIGMHFPVEWL